MPKGKVGTKGQRGGAKGQGVKRGQSASQERPQTQKNGRHGRSPTPAGAADDDDVSDDNTNRSSQKLTQRSPSPTPSDTSPHKSRQQPKEKATAEGPSTVPL